MLHYAVEGGNRDIVKILLQDGLGPVGQPRVEREFTPLHLAARVGHAELVPLLLDAGYAADSLDNEGRTPLHCAALGSQAGWVDATQVRSRSTTSHVSTFLTAFSAFRKLKNVVLVESYQEILQFTSCAGWYGEAGVASEISARSLHYCDRTTWTGCRSGSAGRCHVLGSSLRIRQALRMKAPAHKEATFLHLTSIIIWPCVWAGV